MTINDVKLLSEVQTSIANRTAQGLPCKYILIKKGFWDKIKDYFNSYVSNINSTGFTLKTISGLIVIMLDELDFDYEIVG